MSLEFFQLPPEGKTVLIAVNPRAGIRSGRPLVEQLHELLSAEGYTVEEITDLDQLAARARELHQAGTLRAVVAAGGDGTAAEVVNRTLPGVPIVLFPLGTENLLSKYVGISPSPPEVCQMICAGRAVRLDAGRVGNRLFLLMVGIGFDADVVRRLHRERQGHIQHLSYAKPILDSIRSYQYPELRLYCDQPEGETAEDAGPIVARWAFVVNLPRYALGLSLVPDADGTDGKLDVCTFKEGSFWHGLWYLSGVVLGQHRSLEGCTTTRARRVRIEANEPVPYQLDGDPGGYLPIEIDVLPHRVTLVVPQRWLDDRGAEAPPQAAEAADNS